VILDADMMAHEILNFHPLDNTMTTTIGRDDLVRFLEATGHVPRVMGLTAETVEPGG
jgi:Ala-tRNA(Pro) deacylase